jgi:hypothetical protein
LAVAPDHTLAYRAPAAAPPAVAASARAHRLRNNLPLCLGCFALVMALLLPLYAYPRMAVLPADPQQAQVQRASGATLLVPDLDAPAGARVVKNANVTVTTFVAAASDEPAPGTVVWELATSVRADGHGLVDARVERVSLDARTAEPVNCCGDRLVTDQNDRVGKPLVHDGYITFPFDTAERDYLLWDVQLGRARLAKFMGEETREGLRTFRFEARTELEGIGRRKLPGGLFGVSTPSVTAVEEYADTRTYWVEPATGTTVDLHDDLLQQFRYGGRVVTAMSAELDSPPLDEALLKDVRMGATMLPWLRERASVVLVVLGLSLLTLWGYARSRRTRPASRSTNRSASRWTSDIRPSP